MLKNEIKKYVRTEYGYILENTIGGHGDIIKKLGDRDKHYEFEYGKIVKSSDRLVTIVEVGDYINGEKIIEIQVPEVEIISPDDYIHKTSKSQYVYLNVEKELIIDILKKRK